MLPDKISLIIPACNEASSLEKNILTIMEVIEGIMSSYEIIIAEDGSTDGTDVIASELVEDNRILYSHSDERLGEGS